MIALTGLFAGLLLIAMLVAFIRPNDFAASTGFGMLLLSLGSVLFQAFVVIFVIVLITMAATWIKKKYLDRVLAKLDMLAAQKAELENTGETLAVMNGKMERIEKKLDNIERNLGKVA